MSSKTRSIFGGAILGAGFLVAGCGGSGSLTGPKVIHTEEVTFLPHDADTQTDSEGRRGAKSPEGLDIR